MLALNSLQPPRRRRNRGGAEQGAPLSRPQRALLLVLLQAQSPQVAALVHLIQSDNTDVLMKMCAADAPAHSRGNFVTLPTRYQISRRHFGMGGPLRIKVENEKHHSAAPCHSRRRSRCPRSSSASSCWRNACTPSKRCSSARSARAFICCFQRAIPFVFCGARVVVRLI